MSKAEEYAESWRGVAPSQIPIAAREMYRRLLKEERAQLLADIATAEQNLQVLAYTSEKYSGELDQPIDALVVGISHARLRLVEIEQEMSTGYDEEEPNPLICEWCGSETPWSAIPVGLPIAPALFVCEDCMRKEGEEDHAGMFPSGPEAKAVE